MTDKTGVPEWIFKKILPTTMSKSFKKIIQKVKEL
jgi:hypothetical protein